MNSPVQQATELQQILDSFMSKNARLEEILSSVKASINRIYQEPTSTHGAAGFNDKHYALVPTSSMVSELNTQLGRLQARINEAEDIDSHLKRLI